jgi:hypothetical protein
VSSPVLDQHLSFAQRCEDLAVEKFGIMEQAHHVRGWWQTSNFGFNEAWPILSLYRC